MHQGAALGRCLVLQIVQALGPDTNQKAQRMHWHPFHNPGTQRNMCLVNTLQSAVKTIWARFYAVLWLLNSDPEYPSVMAVWFVAPLLTVTVGGLSSVLASMPGVNPCRALP